jgi:hypothetical protein
MIYVKVDHIRCDLCFSKVVKEDVHFDRVVVENVVYPVALDKSCQSSKVRAINSMNPAQAYPASYCSRS